jgi:lipooligosaccharide transport system permease protein
VTTNTARTTAASSPLGPFEGTGLIVYRNYVTYKSSWKMFLTGFLEPVFYLFSIGIGVGKLIHAFELNGHAIPYAEFVAPGMLAASAFNGALLDSTFNVFFKLRYAKTYDAVLATPLGVGDVAVGEVTWALIRGTLYALGFVAVMAVFGLVASPWAVLTLPAAMLIGFAFAAVGMAATTFMRQWTDFDYITMVTLPLFLFSATFYPISAYPEPLRVIVQLTPLYHGVDLLRALTIGAVHPGILIHVAYLVTMGLIGLAIVARRLDKLLLK